MYHVAMKILLKRGDYFLLLTEAGGERYDLPGGRIDDVEHDVPLEKILDREVREELGEMLKYKLGNPLFQFRRHFENKNFHVFITVYEADYLSGEIILSSEHSKYQWMHKKEFQFEEKNFFSREEYEAFKKYLKEMGIKH